MQTKPGLRAIALFEGVKGVVVLAAGFGAVALVHRDLQAIAEGVVRHSHLNPAARFPRVFVDLAERTTDARLWALAGMAAAYATVRLLEGYGLWHGRRWAEWLGAASGGIYVPVETFEIGRRFTFTRLVLLVGNLIVVVYLLRQLYIERDARAPGVPPDRGSASS